MKKIFGSGWIRFILVLALYVCYFFLVLPYIINHVSIMSGNPVFGVWEFIVLALCVIGFICGWKFVRNIDTSAGFFMVIIKVLLAAWLGLIVLPFVIGSIPYKICHRNDIVE